ncbi:MAG: fused MFS/spermidine synthase, partial [Planctomycetota bacterium]|nr:fused MFS/spermidine synthase [Planctomycetota bacterium]
MSNAYPTIEARTTQAPKSLRADSPLPLYVLFIISGIAGLIYEVMWMRHFSLVFGSTTRAASAVLAAFFFGMAVGNMLGGRWAKDRAGALLRYGLAEFGIAIGALIVIVWVNFYQAHYPELYQSRLAAGGGLTVIQLLLAFLAMAPPCVAMGTTLPLISQAIVVRTGHIGRRVAGIYALNTLGATAGVLLSGFILPVWIGTRGAVYLAALINLAAGIWALILWHKYSRRKEASDCSSETILAPQNVASQTGPEARRLDPWIGVVAAASGFGTLAMEVLYTRFIVNAIDSSVYSFALVLATFLVSLAIGSAVVSAIVDRLQNPWKLIAWTSAPAAIAILLSPSIFMFASVNLAVPKIGPNGYFLWLIMFSMLVMGPSVILMGMTLPAAWKIATSAVGDVGRGVGRLTSINTLAAVAGSMAAGFVIIPSIGAGAGFAVIAGLYGLVAVIASFRAARGMVPWLASATIIASLTFLLVRGYWQVRPLHLQEGEEIVRYHEGENGTVAVTRTREGVLSLKLNNRYLLASDARADVLMQKSQGRLGLLLHDEPRSVAFIGVATGIGVSSVKEFPSIQRVVAMELIPGVIQVVDEFSSKNDRVLDDPIVETILADGRNHLYGSLECFDVIVGDLFVPWHAGTGYLYTKEHFQIVQDRLHEGGLFVQWLMMSQVSLQELRIITAGFTDVFADTQLWLSRQQDAAPLLALVGRKPAELPEESSSVTSELGIEPSS